MKQRKHPYLYSRNGTFYFRYRLSKASSHLLFRQEIVRSLKTTELDKAAAKCLHLHKQAKKLEKLAGAMSRKHKLTEEKAEELIQEYFSREYEDQEIFQGMDFEDSTRDYSRELEKEDETHQAYKREIMSGKFSNKTIYDAHELLTSKKITLPTELGPRNAFYQNIARANAELYRIFIETIKGTFTDRLVKDPLFMESHGTSKPGYLTSNEMHEVNKKPSELVKEFIKEKQGNWAAETKAENKRTFDILVELLEDKPIHLIKRPDMVHVREQLQLIPKNFVKYKKFKGMNISEAIEKDNGKTPVSTKTSSKAWNTIKSFMSWAIRNNRLDINIIYDLTIKDKSNPRDKRDPFSTEELKTWFSCPIYTGCHSKRFRTNHGKHIFKDALYWVPLIALYSGLRLAEIIQMEIDDIKQEQDVWYFYINLHSDNGIVKSIKNGKSRKVPIHYKLIEIGFLEFHEERKAQGNIRIFDEMKRSKNESVEKGNYSDLFSRKFTQCLENLKMKRPELVFHSFRHNVVDALLSAGVNDVHRKDIVGHAQSGMDRTYPGKDVTELKKCVDRIEYDIELDHLTRVLTN